ncbi:LOW QUALITY PROTEIN: hypothetical protein Cgig2_029019 [Carnegiea gigantea]|uniref:Uncharacterized protein n=1 Tax=Carnegiea gigantea TaxID=171969 RepID=A0A9Q1GWT4_9CARY|nr:LOW QUALITY PROTEIN: hypothetical protein Cgig2_029019 [Carnegiea gigantea]
MTDAIMQQVSEQVKKAVEAASSARLLPHFEYMPTGGYEPCHRHDPPIHEKRTMTVPLGPTHTLAIVQATDGRQSQPRLQHRMQHTLDELPGSKNKSRTRGLEIKPLKDDGLQSAALTASARKVPLARGTAHEPRFLRRERELARPEPQDEECSTEVLASEKHHPVCLESPASGRPASSHSRARDSGHGTDNNKLTCSGQDIAPLVHPILGFGGQEVNPTRIIRLPLRFGDIVKAKNLEVDFLVMDVPMAYNIILGRPTLHKTLIEGQQARKGDYNIQSNIWLPIVITTPVVCGSMAFIVRVSSLAVQRRHLLVLETPSTKGGLNPPIRGPDLWLRPTDVPPRTGGRPRSSLPHGKLGPGSQGPCGRTQHSLRDLGERNIKAGERGIKKKRREKEGTLHTSVIASSSSVTLNGSKEPEGARSRTWSRSSSGVPGRQLRLLPRLEKRSFLTAICSGVASLDSKGVSFSRTCSIYNKKESGQNKIKRPARRGQEEVILKIFQFRQLVQRLPITRSTPFLLWSSHRFYHLGYEFREGLRAVIFPYVVMEIVGRPCFLLGRFPKRIPDRLPIIPIGKVPPARLLVNEEEVVLPILYPQLLRNGRHVTLLIVETIPSQILGLTRSPLDRMNQAKCPGGTTQPAQLACCNKRTYVAPGHGHNLHRHQLILFKISTITGWRGNLTS